MHDLYLHKLDPVPRSQHVIRLRPVVRGATDPEALKSLFATLPPDEAEDLVSRSLETLADIANAIRRRVDTDASSLPALIAQASEIALSLGLTGISEICRHVSDCCDGGTAIDRTAVATRLHRMALNAPHDLWEGWDNR